MPRPQAFTSEFAPRLRGHFNSLLVPIVTPAVPETLSQSRKTKRGTNIVSYAEDLLAGDEYDDSDGPRRLTGLRTRREDLGANKEENLVERLTTELVEPVSVQGIWRDWMGKPKIARTDKQANAQAGMPTTLIPIRIDLEIPSFTPAAALPIPADAAAFNVNPLLPAYRAPEATPAYRLKDFFLWNLHETLITPDQFAAQMVNELDLPNPGTYTMEISKQIREQLLDYAGVALHPLFQSMPSETPLKPTMIPESLAARGRTPGTPATPRNGVATEAAGTPGPPVGPDSTPQVEAVAYSTPFVNNPDDAYRCIINLNVNILNRLYTDKFEWSLLHSSGLAEQFARQTCADIGLTGEWVPAIAHAIYEAVLRLKKDVCENGSLLGAEVLNDAIEGQESGWRYEPDGLADEWEPKIEVLSKEDIERREGDRERQLRRARRETARFSSTTNVGGSGTPGYFDAPDEEAALGRGARNAKKKRRFRSLSPDARGGNTPAESAGFGGGGGQLSDYERQNWRCANCYVPGTAVWSVRDGPSGSRTICATCGFYFEKYHQLPPWSQYLHFSKFG